MSSGLKNKITKGTDKPVIFDFDFSLSPNFAENGLSNFTDIKIIIGTEEYSTVDDPNLFYTEDVTTLILKIGMVTSLEDGFYNPTITGYNGQNYINGFPLNSDCDSRLYGALQVC